MVGVCKYIHYDNIFKPYKLVYGPMGAGTLKRRWSGNTLGLLLNHLQQAMTNHFYRGADLMGGPIPLSRLKGPIMWLVVPITT